MSGPMPQWRVLDTGLRSGAENIALDRAILEAHQAGLCQNTLRFLRFTPSALLGFHQHVEQELHLTYCQQNSIEVQRRITGGGAIYFDEAQLGWELYVDRGTLGTADILRISERLCRAAARGLSRLGVDARFRPRNDIEVNGRKISGTGGAFDGGSLMFQGTVLIDLDVERMLRVLRIPAEKLSDKAIPSARDRVTSLRELLGAAPSVEPVRDCLMQALAEELGVRFEPACGLSSAEEQRFREALAEIASPHWVYQANRPRHEAPMLEGIHRCAGGLLSAQLLLDTHRRRIKQVYISGDFFVSPRRTVLDLEAVLRDTAVEDLERSVIHFFDGRPAEMLLLTPRDFIAVIERALAQSDLAEAHAFG